jgi:inorganic pyrophosphatase
LSQIDAEPLSIMRAKVIGVMRMEDKGTDDKIIAVCADDMSVNYINELDELPPHFTVELKHFFMRYKELEQSQPKVEAFYGREKALSIVREAIVAYQRDIVPLL